MANKRITLNSLDHAIIQQILNADNFQHNDIVNLEYLINLHFTHHDHAYQIIMFSDYDRDNGRTQVNMIFYFDRCMIHSFKCYFPYSHDNFNSPYTVLLALDAALTFITLTEDDGLEPEFFANYGLTAKAWLSSGLYEEIVCLGNDLQEYLAGNTQVLEYLPIFYVSTAEKTYRLKPDADFNPNYYA